MVNLDRINKTCRELFVVRRYRVETSATNFISGLTEDNKIVHLYVIDNKLNVATFKHYYSLFLSSNVNIGIIVYPGSITSSVKNIVKLIYEMRIEIFAYKQMCFNILKHICL